MNLTEPLKTRKPNRRESLLKEKYHEAIAGQSDLMDDLAQKLLTVQLGVAGLYATALRLVPKTEAASFSKVGLSLTFGFWAFALAFTLAGIIPKNWHVDPQIMRQDPNINDGDLGIEDFFIQSARYKRRWLLAAIILFFAGVLAAAFTIF